MVVSNQIVPNMNLTGFNWSKLKPISKTKLITHNSYLQHYC